MAGRNQHYIPRLILRGFLARQTARDEYAWVARKSGEIFCGNLEGIAAQRDFYSEPARPGEITLDQRITDYEQRLTPLVVKLRALAVGAVVDTTIAAEVIAHLAPRAATIRSLFSDALGRLITQAAPVLADPDVLRRVAGLNAPAPTETFRTEVFEKIKAQIPIPHQNAPLELVESLAFAWARENMDEWLESMRPDIQIGLGMMDAMAPDRVRDGHQKALGQTLVADARVEKLSHLTWRIEPAPQGGALLPDCIALAYDQAGLPAPYIMADQEDAAAIVMPLSDKLLLVGLAPSATIPDLADFNAHAAACSDQLIVTAHRDHPLEDLLRTIGKRSEAFIAEHVDKIVDNFGPAEPQAAPLRQGQGFSFDIRCPDWEDQDAVDMIGSHVGEIVTRLAGIWPLQRLDGLTFAFDYEGELESLDTGLPEKPAASQMPIEEGLSVSMAVRVLRDGVLKSRIVMRAPLALALLGEDEDLRPRALHVLIAQLAHVSLMTLIEDHWPGVLLEPFADLRTHQLYARTHQALFSYFVARQSAQFSDPLDLETELAADFVHALRRHVQVLQEAAMAFEIDGDINRRYQTMLDVAGEILDRLARLLGHRHGLDQRGLSPRSPVTPILEKLELVKWFGLLEADLERLWLHRGNWPSFAAFSDFAAHTERLLWQLGAMSWRISDEEFWIQFLTVEGLGVVVPLLAQERE